MATLAKMVTKTLDVGVSNTTIDLSATIKSFDVLDTKFIFGITSNQGLAINLSGATVKYIVEYYVEGKTYAIEGNCLVVDINTISFNLPDQLRGYNGKALIGIYATLTDGTKIDIKNIVVNIEPSLMDKGTDFKARYYFESFDNVLASVKDAGNKAISQINTVLPGVQSKVAEIDRQIRSLPPIPDLYVAYADDANGNGFSKTDNSKLFKGYSVRNSTSPSDYRWGKNTDDIDLLVENLCIVSRSVSGYRVVDGLTSSNKGTYPCYEDNKCVISNLIECQEGDLFTVTITKNEDNVISVGWFDEDELCFNRPNGYDSGVRFTNPVTFLAPKGAKYFAVSCSKKDIYYLKIHKGKIKSRHSPSQEDNANDENLLGHFDFKNTQNSIWNEEDYSFIVNSTGNTNKDATKLQIQFFNKDGSYSYSQSTTNKNGYFSTILFVDKEFNDLRVKINGNNQDSSIFFRGSKLEVGSIYTFSCMISGLDIEKYGYGAKIYEIAVRKGIYPMKIWKKSTEDLLLKGHSINSIIITTSSQNPSSSLGGTWTQLGNESKFNQTIYYWKRTN